MEIVLIGDLVGLTVVILWLGFRHLARLDAEEGQQNREDSCSYHAWAPLARGGLRCAACGKAARIGR